MLLVSWVLINHQQWKYFKQNLAWKLWKFSHITVGCVLNATLFLMIMFYAYQAKLWIATQPCAISYWICASYLYDSNVKVGKAHNSILTIKSHPGGILFLPSIILKSRGKCRTVGISQTKHLITSTFSISQWLTKSDGSFIRNHWNTDSW